MNRYLVTMTLTYDEVLKLQEYRLLLEKNLSYGKFVEYQLIRKIGNALDDLIKQQHQRRMITKG